MEEGWGQFEFDFLFRIQRNFFCHFNFEIKVKLENKYFQFSSPFLHPESWGTVTVLETVPKVWILRKKVGILGEKSWHSRKDSCNIKEKQKLEFREKSRNSWWTIRNYWGENLEFREILRKNVGILREKKEDFREKSFNFEEKKF